MPRPPISEERIAALNRYIERSAGVPDAEALSVDDKLGMLLSSAGEDYESRLDEFIRAHTRLDPDGLTLDEKFDLLDREANQNRSSASTY